MPSAIAIIMVPMISVQTIWLDEKYGASSRDAPSSTAITLIPEKNSVRYRNHFFRIIDKSPFAFFYL